MRPFPRALRLLLRSPLSSVLVVLSLAAGIAVAVATFAVVDAVLIRPLPFVAGDRLLFVLSSAPERGIPLAYESFPNYEDAKRELDCFAALEAVSNTRPFLLSSTETPRSLKGEFVTPGFFGALGVEPRLGRGFSERDADPGGPLVAMISEDVWREELGADPEIAGKTLILNEQPFEVVGVVPTTYRGALADRADLWVPIGTAGRLLGERFRSDRSMGWLALIGRLAPGADRETAVTELERLSSLLEQQYPKDNDARRAITFEFRELYFGEGLQRALVYLLLGGLCLLLLCSLNVASLLAGEALAQQRELAVRLALGGNRRSIFRLYIGPLAILVALGAGTGLLLAKVAAPRFLALSDIPPATFHQQLIDPRVAALAVACAVVLALALAAVPIVILRRMDVPTELRAGTRSRDGHWRLRAVLVGAEVSIAVLLMIGAGLMLRSVQRLALGNPGFSAERLTTLPVELQTQRYADAELRRQFAARAVTELAADPAIVQAAASAKDLPPNAIVSATLQPVAQLGIEEAAVQVFRQAVTPGYFETLAIPILDGRALTAADREDAMPVAVVSESVARALAGAAANTGTVLGERFVLNPTLDGDVSEEWTIVGVVPDVKGRGIDSFGFSDRDIYLPYAQAPARELRLVARAASTELGPTGRKLQAVVRGLDGSLAVLEPETMRDRYAERAGDQRFGAVLLSTFSTLALVLAAIGLYGSLNLNVRARRQELAVRLSLGATPKRLLAIVLRQGLLVTAIGITAGVLISFLLNRWISSFLFGTSPVDPLVLTSSVLVLCAVAALGSLVPAVRAMRTDPVEVLHRGD